MKKKVVALIQARMGSTRRPGKVLTPVKGKPLLKILTDRMKLSKTLDVLGVVTTGNPADDAIAQFCHNEGVYCSRGSERDVLDRYYRAAKELKADVLVRITSDCPIVDPMLVDEAVQAFLNSDVDFLGTTEPLPNQYPDGMDVSIFSMQALETAWKEAEKVSEREHVTFFITNAPERFKIKKLEAPANWQNFRFCVDYEEDLQFLDKVFTELEKRNQFGHLSELIQLMNDKPEIKEINSKFQFGAGWASSFEKDKALESRDAKLAAPLKLEKCEESWKKAIKYIPGGAQTFSKMPKQFVNGVAPKMLYRGRGGRVWDLDGNEYVDFVLGLGPIVLGHCYKEVDDAAAEIQRDLFSCPSLPHPLEAELAEKICEMVPCAEMVRYGKNGSDATAGAVRLARGITGRDIVACSGYHGWQDWYIGQTPRNKGIPTAIGNLTKSFEYNNIESVKKVFEENPGNVAALILEPLNFDPPKDNFLHQVRELCDHYGALLIFDEVVTGFRVHKGGAQAYFGVTPDIACFAKALANGYPISAIAGKGKYISQFEDIFFSFTYSGEVPAMAAALKTLDIIDRENVPEHLHKMGNLFIDGFRKLITEMNVPYFKVKGYGHWPKYEVSEANGYTSFEIQSLFQQELVRNGILTRLTPFICYSHSPAEIREFLVASQKAMAVVKDAVESRKLEQWLQGEIIEPVIRDARVKH